MTSPARARGPLHCLLLAAGVALAGCAAAPGPSPAGPAAPAAAGTAPPPVAVPAPVPAAVATPPDPQVLGLWKIEQARAAPIVHKLNARLNFSTDGQLSGSGGCNLIAAPYVLAGNTLQLGRLATTRKHCGEVLMEQEDRVLTALERAVGARVPPHGLLELSDENGTVLLRATRVPSQ